jgi:C1A family cysteine protease
VPALLARRSVEPKVSVYGIGHRMKTSGYDYQSRMFFVRNSWSANWGIEGYC